MNETEKIAEELVCQHHEYKTQGMTEYMKGYYNGVRKAVEYMNEKNDRKRILKLLKRNRHA